MTVTHWINRRKYITSDILNQLEAKVAENKQIAKNTVGAEYDWVKGRIQMTKK